MNRREFLRVSGATAGAAGAGLVVGGVVLNRESLADRYGDRLRARSPGGAHWKLAFEDTFSGDSLDASSWSIGWGWGVETSTSPTRIVSENVRTEGGSLRLRGTHERGEIRSGAVNTKNKVTFGPGSYLEARISFAGRTGFQNAFWAKPNTEAWPPEVDVVEIWQDDTGWDDRHISRHTVHYSSSREVGDRSTHKNLGASYTPGGDLTREFHTYGVEWQADELVHYVDGKVVRKWLGETLLTALSNGAPFYFMFSLNINNIGTADQTERWGEEMVVDWVRLWEDTSP
ncbi:family 16 glycosylhydrolase [Haloferax sp. KTX1]|uniref:glycoside hydrolase family 16 protein n=1 Tax=Haloferax sp. KTX1 TaxID=2600597 RepID=UPI0011DD8AFC|nr:glycoside hydrolase family 16 protein [Haloferax sp. KTX1]